MKYLLVLLITLGLMNTSIARAEPGLANTLIKFKGIPDPVTNGIIIGATVVAIAVEDPEVKKGGQNAIDYVRGKKNGFKAIDRASKRAHRSVKRGAKSINKRIKKVFGW
ncbi:hypothetical protein [uncultured Cocleimonas sp.]|uniref:hypothetical protein n=1 Tax=uncultured Cocleimonas sp. TaxID=1051587 RepID=UPI00262C84A9|nr:hypothetical protein [uncultured Cocleimonas sp.]